MELELRTLREANRRQDVVMRGLLGDDSAATARWLQAGCSHEDIARWLTGEEESVAMPELSLALGSTPGSASAYADLAPPTTLLPTVDAAGFLSTVLIAPSTSL
ncbi:hypothetical protein MMC13_007215 [Lambiella insularis]|nr:hypothetical protein [Lambiella insularis]